MAVHGGMTPILDGRSKSYCIILENAYVAFFTNCTAAGVFKSSLKLKIYTVLNNKIELKQ